MRLLLPPLILLAASLHAQPTITGIDPNFRLTKDPPFTLTVAGNGFFVPACTVRWNGANLATTFVNTTTLTAQVPGPLFQNVVDSQSFDITVFCPPATTSNALKLQVVEEFGVYSLDPPSIVAGSPLFTLTVNGGHFQATDVVLFNSIVVPTTYISRSQLRAAVPASLVATVGPANVVVRDPGGTSVPFPFQVTASVPILTSLNPSSVVAGSGSFTLTATGSNFAQGSIMLWNGLPVGGSPSGSTQISASIPPNLTSVPGTASITVSNPPNTMSNALTLTITCSYQIAAPNPVGVGNATSAVIPGTGGSGTVNVTTGGGCNWTAASDSPWLTVTSSPSGSGSGFVSYTVSPNTGPARSGTLKIAGLSFTVSQLAAAGAPTIAATGGVINAASAQTTIASGTWISIFGTNLSNSTRSWGATDFVDGRLPTSLDGVSVQVNGLPAYVDFISPGQINALAPADVAEGLVLVQVNNTGVRSNPVTVQKNSVAPGLFMFPPPAQRYAASVLPDGTYIAPANIFPGGSPVTRAARPGETVLLFATGLGDTDPSYPDGRLITQPAPVRSQVGVKIGGVDAVVRFAGIIGAGLYQLNVDIPDIPDGDATVVIQVAGIPSQDGVAVAVHR